MTSDPTTLVLLILISPAVGSFLALAADRLPRGEGVARRPSACRRCGTRLGLRDLIPILSFAMQAGRCRHCGAAIPAWFLYVEIAAIGLAVIAVILGGNAVSVWLTAVFLWLLLALTAADLVWFRLPDLLTAALFVCALTLAWWAGDPGVSGALAGALAGSGTFLALRIVYRALRGREGLGMGDVKLMAGLGAALGPYDLPLMLLTASLTALAVAGVGRLRSGKALSPTRPLPFGAALCAATGMIWVLLRVQG